MAGNSHLFSRRALLQRAALAYAACRTAQAQVAGDRPPAPPESIRVIDPRGRAPVSLIIDDSTCLVNLNKFAIPQFATANPGRYQNYDWRSWPSEIPDAFVRKFGEWAAAHGVKGKYSIVPYPACVGRLDIQIPGWTQQELGSSIDLVRDLMAPNWDIHPEMVTHTRVIDTQTGHPYPEFTPKYMENWDWATGRSVDEIAGYMRYALAILRNIGLPCEGLTTPGGFGSRARPQLAEATFQACRDVFKAEIPHYFRDLFDSGDKSVAPLVQNARGLDTDDPQCVVHIIGCTGDWTGGWDCTEPKGGADAFITADGRSGRMVDVIARGEPAIMVCHWTGVYFNGAETGFKIFQEVVKRLHGAFDHLIWMKNSEIARYWAARELTQITVAPDGVDFQAPYACGDFTVEIAGSQSGAPILTAGEVRTELKQVPKRLQLAPGTWWSGGGKTLACFPLPKGASRLAWRT